MRYVCLACDYDGTLARDGYVRQSTVDALCKVRTSGRRLILVTGRELDDLLTVFPEVSLFDRIVVENGGVLYRPSTRERISLGEPPPRAFVEELSRRGVQPLSTGQCIVATWHPHESTVLEVIRAMGLGLQIVLNKNAVMVLPSAVNKGTGLEIALQELGLSAHNVVGVGDAENDHAFLTLCECSVAVNNALSALKERADWITHHSHGEGVEELIQQLLYNDLADLTPRLARHDILLGSLTTGEPFSLKAYGSRLLIAGPSGSGKSSAVSSLVERLVASQYQVCLFDPEGDYDELEGLVTLGGPERVPGPSEVQEILDTPDGSLSINLIGVPLADRPAFFQSLLSRIQELRFKTGRPHWVVVDEVHHLLPAELAAANVTIPKDLESFALVTVHPHRVSRAILGLVGGIIALGPDPQEVVSQFNAGSGQNLQTDRSLLAPLEAGQVLVWLFSDSAPPRRVKVHPAKSQRRRHHRKYSAGELGEDRSFCFCGVNGQLRLRAHNMDAFARLIEGVDDETWTFHLSKSDYSRWLRDIVKDEEIAKVVAEIEANRDLSPAESRHLVVEAIRRHYTAPARHPAPEPYD